MASGMSASHERNRLGTERSLAQSRIEREGLAAGTPAPVFALPDPRGRVVSLEEYRGRRVLLVFSDPNCGPCDALLPDLVRLQKEHPELRFIMVSRGDRAANQEKARFHGFPFPVVIQDGWKISKEYGIFATPVAFLIDERGAVAKPVAVGDAQILALIAEEPASVISRWRALGPIAAAFVGGLLAAPMRAVAQPTCPPGQTNCIGKCIDLNVDPSNCGSCGRACPAGAICRSGQCVLTCAAGQVICAGRCVETSRDAQNCGNCGRVCPSGSICQDGQCVSVPCAAGQTKCGSGCVDVSSDPRHCGTCGNACAAGSVCRDGRCVVVCPQGQALCGGTCVNLSRDIDNCGACGKTCPSGHVCREGKCVVSCPSGQTNCAGTCTNLTYDPRNCGACGKVCPAGYICQNGQCVRCR